MDVGSAFAEYFEREISVKKRRPRALDSSQRFHRLLHFLSTPVFPRSVFRFFLFRPPRRFFLPPSPPLFFIVHANLSLLDKHSAYGRPRSTDSRERYGWRARGRGRRNRGGKQKTARAPQIGTRSAIPRNLSDQSRSGESSAGRHTRSTSDHELENGTTTHLISRIDTGAGFNRDPLRKNRKSLLFSPEKTNLLL